MITRYRIKLGADTVLDLAEHQAFELDDVDYPADWIERDGTVPGHTIEAYDATPTPPPPEPPSASGAQMIYEADTRGKLETLLAALTQSERAKLYARRRIIAGDDVAEALRARLSVTVAAMKSFIVAASLRSEV